jgi:GNAT superfamily N-acetyltransferase
MIKSTDFETIRPFRTFLPGRISFTDGTRRDYQLLARHHYQAKPPATWALIRVAWHHARGRRRAIAVAVLSYPVPLLSARLEHFALRRKYGPCLRFANANLRTVSRVIVHPQFRSIGLACALTRQLVERCPTRYVEASARMARFIAFFERAGFTRVASTDPDRPDYFILDKQGKANNETKTSVDTTESIHPKML